jgi:hypothetical protein
MISYTCTLSVFVCLEEGGDDDRFLLRILERHHRGGIVVVCGRAYGLY